ncbi:hypothetical protein IWX50DRAFT_45126 [Phyllosticta citricarpa]|uniref:Uncharacterized protein n=1 Tax=Phyllosticta citricarpa TaxID=55181 RepID=A0ABR1LZR0_9PEZI
MTNDKAYHTLKQTLNARAKVSSPHHSLLAPFYESLFRIVKIRWSNRRASPIASYLHASTAISRASAARKHHHDIIQQAREPSNPAKPYLLVPVPFAAGHTVSRSSWCLPAVQTDFGLCSRVEPRPSVRPAGRPTNRRADRRVGHHNLSISVAASKKLSIVRCGGVPVFTAAWVAPVHRLFYLFLATAISQLLIGRNFPALRREFAK